MEYPEIYLAVDNCFASKRWTRPAEWAELIRELGISYVEASADTELDPLFMGEEYLQRWVAEAEEAQRAHGVQVVNLYSGHGTYSTLGLTHTDVSVRRRMLEQWFKPLLRIAGRLGAGMGFFAHAFENASLQHPDLYEQKVQTLFENLAELNAYAGTMGVGVVGVEQMYSPHQYPYRIDDAKRLLREVFSRSGRSFYITEDVGHHQKKFLRPNLSAIRHSILTGRTNGETAVPWLGSDKAYSLYDRAVQGGDVEAVLQELEQEMSGNPHLFASVPDADCYEWLRALGAYSPIIHLQQTDGTTSAHWSFTRESNARGIIHPQQLLAALKHSFEQPMDATLGKPVKCIYLTLELFAGTASINYETIREYKESVAYWRQYIRDGARLNEL